MRVLFCTEGSECSLASFKNAASFINKAIVDIICVIDWNFLPSSMNIESSDYSKAYDNIADSVLNFSETLVKEHDFEVGKKIKSIGSASEAILEALADEQYDLVILGSQGKKGIQKWLGSVSRQVVTNTKVPCFISRKEIGNKKVLFATDGSMASDDAAQKFVSLFKLQEKEVSILSVKENPEYFPIDATMDKYWLEAIEKQQKIQATKSVNKIKMILENANIPVQSEIILTGNPAQKIIEFCAEEQVDLVVMGARAKNDLSKVLLGSVSHRVLDNVNCGVLIISR